MKKYWVITRTAQVWDELRFYEAESEEEALDKAREDEEFNYAEMISEEVEYLRLARADEVDWETLKILGVI
jgi:hypothetical protein